MGLRFPINAHPSCTAAHHEGPLLLLHHHWLLHLHHRLHAHGLHAHGPHTHGLHPRHHGLRLQWKVSSLHPPTPVRCPALPHGLRLLHGMEGGRLQVLHLPVGATCLYALLLFTPLVVNPSVRGNQGSTQTKNK